MVNLRACDEILDRYTIEQLRDAFYKSENKTKYDDGQTILVHCVKCEPMAVEYFCTEIRNPEKDRKKTWPEEVYKSYNQVQKDNIRTIVKLDTSDKRCYFCWIDPKEPKHQARIYVAWGRLGKPLMWKQEFCPKGDAVEKIKSLCEEKKTKEPQYEIVDYRLDVLKMEEEWVATVPLTHQGGNGAAAIPTVSSELSNALKALTNSRTPHGGKDTGMRESRRSQRLDAKNPSKIKSDPEGGPSEPLTIQEMFSRCGPLGEDLFNWEDVRASFEKARGGGNMFCFMNEKPDGEHYMIWIDPGNTRELCVAYAPKGKPLMLRKVPCDTSRKALELLTDLYLDKRRNSFQLCNLDLAWNVAKTGEKLAPQIKTIQGLEDGTWQTGYWDSLTRCFNGVTELDVVRASLQEDGIDWYNPQGAVAWTDPIMKFRVYDTTGVDGSKVIIRYQDTKSEQDAKKVLATILNSSHVDTTRDGKVQIKNIFCSTKVTPDSVKLQPAAGSLSEHPAKKREPKQTTPSKTQSTTSAQGRSRQNPGRNAKNPPKVKSDPEGGPRDPDFWKASLKVNEGRVEADPVNQQASKTSKERSSNASMSTPRSAGSTSMTRAASQPRIASDANWKPTSTPGLSKVTSRTREKTPRGSSKRISAASFGSQKYADIDRPWAKAKQADPFWAPSTKDWKTLVKKSDDTQNYMMWWNGVTIYAAWGKVGDIPRAWKWMYHSASDAEEEFTRIYNEKSTVYKGCDMQFERKEIDGRLIEVPISSRDCASQSAKQANPARSKSGGTHGTRIPRSGAQKGK